MRGWGWVKNFLSRVGRAVADVLKTRPESPNDSSLSSDSSRTAAEWGNLLERMESANKIAEAVERELEERFRQEQEEAERERREREEKRKPKEPASPSSHNEGGLGSPPAPNDYGGAVPLDQVRWHSSQWIVRGNFQIVQNSRNVHAIAYDVDRGSLFVQYKHWDPSMPFGAANGPGPVYEYKNVSIAEAHALYRAASVGEWLWDHVRVRGTWSQHQKPYKLVSISGGYLPRKATLWKDGREWFVQRRAFDANGGAIVSQLPTAPAPPWGARPNRARPNRGRPNNGRPNTGRP